MCMCLFLERLGVLWGLIRFTRLHFVCTIECQCHATSMILSFQGGNATLQVSFQGRSATLQVSFRGGNAMLEVSFQGGNAMLEVSFKVQMYKC